MKILTPTFHSALDYLVVILLWMVPSFLDLNESIAILTYALGVIHLLLTIFTNFPYGIVKVIPFRVHGYIELLVSIILVTSPLYISNFTTTDSVIDLYFFSGFGVIVFITWLISDYQVTK